MNSDIRVSVNFLDHPKTVKLERRLGFDGVKALIRLWTWSAINRPDGALGADIEDVEIAARWDGEPGRFVAELVALRWLDEGDDGYRLHDWQEHNPWAADAMDRSDEARLSRLFRTNADKAKEFKAQGRTGITQEEYQEYKNPSSKYDRSTTVVRPKNDRSTERSTPAPAPAPAPAPIPTPFSFFPAVESEPPPVPQPDEPPKKEKMGGDVSDSSRRPIPDDWQPQPATLDICVQQGMTAEFARQQGPPFVLHHREAGTQRSGFESLFIGWCKRAWEKRPPDERPGVRRRGQTLMEKFTEDAAARIAAEEAEGYINPLDEAINRLKQEAGHVH